MPTDVCILRTKKTTKPIVTGHKDYHLFRTASRINMNDTKEKQNPHHLARNAACKPCGLPSIGLVPCLSLIMALLLIALLPACSPQGSPAFAGQAETETAAEGTEGQNEEKP